MAEQTGGEVCSICLNDFQEPKIINCQHAFCYNCLEDYVHRTTANGHFLCPICRQSIKLSECGINAFPSKQKMANDRTLQIQKCDVCLNIQAAYRCRDCQQHLCDACKSTHDKLVGCKGHTVVTLDKISNQDLKSNSSEISAAEIKENIHPADFCSNHPKKKAKAYCKDCLAAVCFKCFLNDHNGHTFLDLKEDDVREQIREELKTLKVEIQNHINKLQHHSTSLQSKLSEVKEAAQSAREIVDTHVRNMCAKVHEMGENIKEEIQKICNDENEKFTQLMTNIKTLTQDLQSGVKFSTNILEDTSVVQVLERLPKVHQEADKCRSRKLNIPDVMYPTFKGPGIKEAVLREQLGDVNKHLETRFINTFNINQFKHDDEIYSSATTFHGLPWFISADKVTPDQASQPEALAFYLCLGKGHSDILSCNVDYSLGLINQLDENRSVVCQYGKPIALKDFKYESGWGFHQFINWDVITNQGSGFLDSNNNFNIQVVLKLMDVKRRKR